MADTLITPYASALPYMVSAMPTWTDAYDAQRLASYDLYDDMYNNRPDTALMLRGSDEKPIFVPTAKRVINTLCRYVGKDWGYEINPIDPNSTADETPLLEAFSSLFARERVISQFVTGLPQWLRRGDWLWMVWADEAKAPGSRIGLKTIDPRTYFPLNNDTEDVDRITGQQIVEQTVLDDGTTIALKVQTWLKYTDPSHTQYIDPTSDATVPEGGIPIEYKCEIVDIKDWQDPKKRVTLQTLVPQESIDGITALPIYHIKNNEETGNPFGGSELSGLESVVAGISQAITDEDLSLALAGLGMFVTDSGAPVDSETGEPIGWLVGPQQVIEVAQGRKFERLAGITSVAPSQQHVDYLEEQAYGTSGINDIALGTRGAVTESGVALAIRMQPLFDAADVKDLSINDVMTQLFHDLATMWFPTFESINFDGFEVTSGTSQDRLPFDRAQFWTELSAGYEAGILPLSYVHRMLNEKLGYELTKEELKAALDEQAAKAAQADPYGARAAAELNGPQATQDSGATANPADGGAQVVTDGAAAA